MKIEKQPLDNHQMKLVLEVDPEPLDAARQKAARKIAKRVKIPGFRPGKAPFNMIQRYVGDEAILEESLEILIKDIYPEMIKESGLDTYGPGRLENVQKLDPLTLEFVVPLAPTVELGDYKSLSFEYTPVTVEESEMESALKNLRENNAVEETVERAVETGDSVQLRISGVRLNPEEGVDPTLVRERPLSVVVRADGDEDSYEWPFLGFSRHLVGLSKDEAKTISYTFPEESEYETLRGVQAEFNVTVEGVKSRSLPELNDDFAQSVGEFETVEALRKELHDGLTRQAEEAINQEYDEKVIDALIETSTVNFPPEMLEDEINEVVHQLEHRLQNQGLDLDTYLKTREIDQAALREEARPVAEARLRRSLVLLEVSQAEGVEITPQELEQEAQKSLAEMTRYMSPEERRKFSPREILPNLVGNIMAEMRMQRTVERLRAIARGESTSTELAPETETQVDVTLETATQTEASGEALPQETPSEIVEDQTADQPETSQGE